MSTLSIKELSHPAGEVIKIASGKTLDLKSQGTTTLPTGSVLQVKGVTMTTPTVAAIAAGWHDISALVLTITPTSTSSKILVQANVLGSVGAGGYLTAIRLKRGSTVIGAGSQGAAAQYNASGISWMLNTYGGKTMSTSHIDSPSTTSATTYQIQFYANGSNNITYIGREHESTNWATSCTLTLMEIQG